MFHSPVRWGWLRLIGTAPFRLSSDDYGTTIISYEEQCKGWVDRINRAMSPTARVEAYAQLQDNLYFYTGIAGTKDLRIAAITLENNAVLLTRNTVDFARVPGLHFEDWTI